MIRQCYLLLCILLPIITPLSVEAAPPSQQAEQLLDKLYAVHATKTLPHADYLQAGFATSHLTPIQKALIPQVRSTLHFALGEVVQPLSKFISWEDHPYAVVTPVRTLLPQLINLNCYDTFILGDLRLGAETFLVVPLELAETIESEATIVTYDSHSQTVREAVNELISSQGGWHIEMDDQDIEDELHVAYLDGENVNTPEFFASLQEGRPWLSVGLRFDPLEGEHYRLSQIEQGLILMAWPILFERDSQLSSLALKNDIIQVNHHFKRWAKSLTAFPWNLESRHTYQRLATELKKWSCLMHEELRIRKIYGKTLAFAPGDFLLSCFNLCDQPEALRVFIDQNREQLFDYIIDFDDTISPVFDLERDA